MKKIIFLFIIIATSPLSSQGQFYLNTVRLEKLDWIFPATESIDNTGQPIQIQVKAQSDAALDVTDFEVLVDNASVDLNSINAKCINNVFTGQLNLSKDRVHTVQIRASKGKQGTPKQTSVLTVISPEKANIPVTEKETRDIKKKARETINSLSSYYNNILSSYELSERNELINNMILPGSKRIFENDGTIVEDDFDSRDRVPQKERDKKVVKYFSDLGAYFGAKENGEFVNEKEIVTLTSIIVSNVRPMSRTSPSESLFLEVNYTINYQGKNTQTNKTFKTGAKRVAEMIAIPDPKSGEWQVLIRSLRFFEQK